MDVLTCLTRKLAPPCDGADPRVSTWLRQPRRPNRSEELLHCVQSGQTLPVFASFRRDSNRPSPLSPQSVGELCSISSYCKRRTVTSICEVSEALGFEPEREGPLWIRGSSWPARQFVCRPVNNFHAPRCGQGSGRHEPGSTACRAAEALAEDECCWAPSRVPHSSPSPSAPGPAALPEGRVTGLCCPLLQPGKPGFWMIVPIEQHRRPRGGRPNASVFVVALR